MPSHPYQPTIAKGQLTAWRFHGDQGWGYGTLTNDGQSINITGTLVGARVGDNVQLEGIWNDHPRFGRTFKFKSCVADVPASSDGLIAWLVATLPGIGQRRATALVERFGVQGLFDAIELEPHRLAEIDGITEDGAKRIAQAYNDARDTRDSMIALRGWELTDSQIAQCLKVWDSLARVVDAVRADPYQLMWRVHGFGFKRADAVAAKLQIPKDAPERVMAGVEYALSEWADAGHIWMPARVLQEKAAELLGVAPKLIKRGAWDAVAAGRVVEINARFYVKRLAKAEETCSMKLKVLANR